MPRGRIRDQACVISIIVYDDDNNIISLHAANCDAYVGHFDGNI